MYLQLRTNSEIYRSMNEELDTHSHPILVFIFKGQQWHDLKAVKHACQNTLRNWSRKLLPWLICEVLISLSRLECMLMKENNCGREEINKIVMHIWPLGWNYIVQLLEYKLLVKGSNIKRGKEKNFSWRKLKNFFFLYVDNFSFLVVD